MKTVIVILFALISFTAFSQTKLYIETLKVEGTGEKQKKSEVVSEVTTTYFEIKLGSQTQKDGTKLYLATKDIVKPSTMANFKMETIAITDSKGDVIKFKSSTDFLNFMDVHGYSVQSSTPSKYGAEYIFKKK